MILLQMRWWLDHMDIYVSSLQAAPILVADHAPASIVSFIDPKQKPPRFRGYKEHNHLILQLNDVSESKTGLTPPGREHMMMLIDFLLRHDWQHNILIHCLMGVSRSTAAAYIMLNLHYEGRELEIAQYLRAKIPHAHPNTKLIEHADAILGREGRMIKAIASLPKGSMDQVGLPMKLSTDFV
ncbi:MAG: tyrosine protein phosphatase [Pseudomonadota bacterium]